MDIDFNDEFGLMALPQHLHRLIIEQLTYYEQARFRLLDSYCNNLVQSYSSLQFPLEVIDVYTNWDEEYVGEELYFGIRPESQNDNQVLFYLDIKDYPKVKLSTEIIIVQEVVNDDFCKGLLEIARRNKVRCGMVHFQWKIDSDPGIFGQLIEALQYPPLIFDYAPIEYFHLPELQKVPKLQIIDASGVNDEIFLKTHFENFEFEACSLTTEGLVKFIKQWRNNQREITSCKISSAEKDLTQLLRLSSEFGIDGPSENFKIQRKHGEKITILIEDNSNIQIFCDTE